MNRIVCLAALTAVLSISLTALAEDTEKFVLPAGYVGSTSDTASVNAAGYSTVLIAKDEENGEVVYIDQADNVYTGVVPFLVKSAPAVGKYKVMLGSETGEPYQTYFYVGVDSLNSSDIAMTRLQNEVQNADKTYNIGYYTVVAADYASTYHSLKVGYTGNSKYGGFDLSKNWDDTHYTSGNLYLIFQLNDVPSDWKDSVTVFLSPDTVSNIPVQ